MKQYLNQLFDGQNLTRSAARIAMTGIMNGEFEDAQIAGFLVALRMKGETVDEIVGFAEAMRSKMTPVPVNVPAIDMCGTGGDGSGTFNISTAASFVVAGAGVPVAKHGNRAISSRSGSADVLTALGVNINISPKEMGRAVDEIGLGFMFAPALHPAMKYAMGARRALGVRTVFNILGPLCNPAGVKRQVIGVFDSELTNKIATALQILGSEKGMIVHGNGNMDEFSLSGPTRVSQFEQDGKIYDQEINPENLGFEFAELTTLAGGTPAENAEIIRQILEGKSGSQRDVVVLNAAAGIAVGKDSLTLEQSIKLAQKSIDSGRAKKVLQELKIIA